MALTKTPDVAFRPTALDTESDAYREVVRAFGDVAAAMGDLRDRDELLHLIARKICELADVRRCSLYLRDPETGLYHGQVGHWYCDIDESIKRLVAGIESDRFTREIVDTRAPVVVRDPSADPRPIRSTMRKWGVRSMLGVPMVLREQVIGIVYLDDEERPRTYTQRDAEIASAFADLAAVAISQSQLTNDLRERLETVATQNEALRRASVVEDRLTALALDGCSIGEIATAVTELTGKPVAVHDAGHRQIAAASPPTNGEPMIPRLLEPAVRSHPDVAEALAGLEPARPAVIGPIPSAGLHHRSLAIAVSVRSDRWGTVVISEYGSRFGRFDMIIGRRAATIIALEMSAERRAAAAECNARDALAAELLREGRDLGDIEHRADYLGVRLRTPQVVALVTRPRGSRGAALTPNDVASLVKDAAGEQLQVLATGVPEGVAVMLELPRGDGDEVDLAAAKRILAEAVDARHDAGRLRIGISNPCAGAARALRAYGEARQVVRCLATFAEGGIRLLGADELGPGRVFLATADPDEVREFARETLAGLLDGDRVQSDLLVTLQTFLDEGGSVRRAAVALDVHENTIRYRLARIEEITGLSVVNESHDRLSAQLAILVIRLQGKLPA